MKKFHNYTVSLPTISESWQQWHHYPQKSCLVVNQQCSMLGSWLVHPVSWWKKSLMSMECGKPVSKWQNSLHLQKQLQQAASPTARDNRLTHYFGIFGVWVYFWGIKLLPVQNLTSHSYSVTLISYEGNKISCLPHLVSEIWCGTDKWQTADRCGNWNRRLSHC